MALNSSAGIDGDQCVSTAVRIDVAPKTPRCTPATIQSSCASVSIKHTRAWRTDRCCQVFAAQHKSVGSLSSNAPTSAPNSVLFLPLTRYMRSVFDTEPVSCRNTSKARLSLDSPRNMSNERRMLTKDETAVSNGGKSVSRWPRVSRGFFGKIKSLRRRMQTMRCSGI